MLAFKKTIAVLLAAAFVLALIPFAASAAGSAQFTLTAPQTANPGETLEYTASMTVNPGILSMRFTVTYSSDLELIAVEDLGKFGTFLWSESKSNRVSGSMSLTWDNGTQNTNFTQTGAFLKLRFTVKNSALPGSLSVKLEGAEAWDKDLEAVSLGESTAFTEILPSGDTYYLYLSESAESSSTRNGTLSNPYYYLSEALNRVKTDGAVTVDDRPIVFLLDGTIPDNSIATSQILGGSTAVSFNGTAPMISVRSLHSDEETRATLVHQYTGSGTLFRVNNSFRFDNINITCAGPSNAFYLYGFDTVFGENVTVTKNNGDPMPLYGGGSGSVSSVYSDYSIEIYSGVFTTVALSQTYRGKVSGDLSLVVGGDAVIQSLYAGASSVGDSANTVLGTENETTFNASVTVTGNAVVTNFYGACSVGTNPLTYTFHSDFTNVISENASITNFYAFGNNANLDGDVTCEIHGGTISNFVLDFATPANGSLTGKASVVFYSGTVEYDSISDTIPVSFSVNLTEDNVTLVNEGTSSVYKLESIVGGKGILYLEKSGSFEPVQVSAISGLPKIYFYFRVPIGDTVMILPPETAESDLRIAGYGCSVIYRKEASDPNPVLLGGGILVTANSMILEENFKLRYLFDAGAVSQFETETGTPFTVEYSVDGENFTPLSVRTIQINSVSYRTVIVQGISAKNIGDTIYLRTSLSSVLDRYSIKNACLDVINSKPGTYSDFLVTLCKAMLNYGRAAQVYFSYRLEDPILTDYYNGIVSKEFTDEADIGDHTGKPVWIRSTTLKLRDYVVLNFLAKVEGDLDPATLTAHVTAGSLTKTSSLEKNGNYYTFFITLPAKDMRKLATAYITNASGEIVSNIYKDSISSYCAYQLYTANVTGEEADLYEYLMAYVDAAKTYLDAMRPVALDDDDLNPVFH